MMKGIELVGGYGGGLTFFNAILVGTLEVRVFGVPGDALNTFIKMVLRGRAFLGICAF